MNVTLDLSPDCVVLLLNVINDAVNIDSKALSVYRRHSDPVSARLVPIYENEIRSLNKLAAYLGTLLCEEKESDINEL